MPIHPVGQIRIRRLLRPSLRWISLTALLCAAPVGSQSPQPKAPPPTRTDNVKDVYHGVEVVDAYRWLEDQKSAETRAWIDAQNAYTESLLKARPGRESLKQKLTALLKIDSFGTPTERNGRYFFTKRLASQDQPVLYLRKGLKGTDEVLIDPHPMSPDHTTTVLLRGVSGDGSMFVYALRQGGADETEIRMFDVDARKDLPGRLPPARYLTVALDPDKKALYYTRMTPEGPRVFTHKVGADPATDAEIFGKGYGPEKIIVSSLSEDGRYLLIHILHGSSADRTEVYLWDAVKAGPAATIVNDVPARFFAEIAGN